MTTSDLDSRFGSSTKSVDFVQDISPLGAPASYQENESFRPDQLFLRQDYNLDFGVSLGNKEQSPCSFNFQKENIEGNRNENSA